jgi:alkanesulfonate monooxygenase SsuD/methylene tetrahydromethanopterin reductase-like flavin-dependent oxidoreductase (luciferase family)
MTLEQFERSSGPRGANFVGSPEQIAEKILQQHEVFDHDRFLIMFTVGPLAHDAVLRSIELFGTRVAPIVREEVAKRRSTAEAT